MPNPRGLLAISGTPGASAFLLDKASRLYEQEAGAFLVIVRPQYVTGCDPTVFLASAG
jgi:hypothetical protein